MVNGNKRVVFMYTQLLALVSQSWTKHRIHHLRFAINTETCCSFSSNNNCYIIFSSSLFLAFIVIFLQTTDMNWKPKFVTEESAKFWKVRHCLSRAIYLVLSCSVRYALGGHSQPENLFRPGELC